MPSGMRFYPFTPSVSIPILSFFSNCNLCRPIENKTKKNATGSMDPMTLFLIRVVEAESFHLNIVRICNAL